MPGIAPAKKTPLTFPNKRREFYLLLPIGLLYSASFGMITVLVPLYSSLCGAREAVVGIIMAMPGVLQVFLRAPCGKLSAYLGARVMFVLSFCCVLIISSLYLILPGYSLFFLPQFFLGIASASFWPSQWAFASELGPKEHRSSVIGYTTAAVGFGSFVGPYVGGYFFDLLGSRAFLFYALTGVLGLVLTLQLPSKKIPRDFPKLSLFFQDTLHDSKRLLGVLPIFYAVCGILLAALSKGANNAFYALYVRSIGHTATIGGILLALHGACSSLIRLLFGLFVRPGYLYRYLFMGVFLNALGMLLMPFSPNPFWMGLVTLLSGLGFGIMYPAAVALIADHTEGSDRMLGMGLFGTALCLGQLSSPMFLGPIAQVFGLGRAFLVGNCFSLLGIALLFIHRRGRGRSINGR